MAPAGGSAETLFFDPADFFFQGPPFFFRKILLGKPLVQADQNHLLAVVAAAVWRLGAHVPLSITLNTLEGVTVDPVEHVVVG